MQKQDDAFYVWLFPKIVVPYAAQNWDGEQSMNEYVQESLMIVASPESITMF